MASGTRTVVVAIAMTSASLSFARAADLPSSMPMPLPPPIQKAQIDDSSGWYLRGDVGYRWNSVSSAAAVAPFPSPTASSMNSSYAFGGGVGLKAGWIRGDVTVDYAMPSTYTGRILIPGDVTGKISSIDALFNLYFDMGTWFGFTPYIGAGVGAAYVNTSGYQSLLAPPFGTPADNSRWNLAWAGMAGISYSLSHSLAVDIGYRYLNMGDALTASDPFGAMTFRNVSAQEVRVGLRWMFSESAFP